MTSTLLNKVLKSKPSITEVCNTIFFVYLGELFKITLVKGGDNGIAKLTIGNSFTTYDVSIDQFVQFRKLWFEQNKQYLGYNKKSNLMKKVDYDDVLFMLEITKIANRPKKLNRILANGR